MTDHIHIIGARGYIGDALTHYLQGEGMQIFQYDALDDQDIRDMDPTQFSGDVVVSLASLNREHEGWNMHNYDVVMNGITRANYEIMQYAKRLIFFSSMRAHSGDNSRYAYHKRKAEEMLDGENVTIIRPGTVFGTWDGYGGAVRGDTAVNFALINGKFEGSHWSAWCSALFDVVNETRAEIINAACPGRRILAPVKSRPVTAEDLRGYLADPQYDPPVPLFGGYDFESAFEDRDDYSELDRSNMDELYKKWKL